jgi:hypothetical protein
MQISPVKMGRFPKRGMIKQQHYANKPDSRRLERDTNGILPAFE